MPPKRYLAITEINVGDKTDSPLPSPTTRYPKRGIKLEFLQAGTPITRRRMERALLALIFSLLTSSAEGHYATSSRSVYRGVQLDFTPEIEVFYMLFESCYI